MFHKVTLPKSTSTTYVSRNGSGSNATSTQTSGRNSSNDDTDEDCADEMDFSGDEHLPPPLPAATKRVHSNTVIQITSVQQPMQAQLPQHTVDDNCGITPRVKANSISEIRLSGNPPPVPLRASSLRQPLPPVIEVEEVVAKATEVVEEKGEEILGEVGEPEGDGDGEAAGVQGDDIEVEYEKYAISLSLLFVY